MAVFRPPFHKRWKSMFLIISLVLLGFFNGYAQKVSEGFIYTDIGVTSVVGAPAFNVSINLLKKGNLFSTKFHLGSYLGTRFVAEKKVPIFNNPKITTYLGVGLGYHKLLQIDIFGTDPPLIPGFGSFIINYRTEIDTTGPGFVFDLYMSYSKKHKIQFGFGIGVLLGKRK